MTPQVKFVKFKSYIINIDKVERSIVSLRNWPMKIPLSRKKEDLIKLSVVKLLLIKSTLTETLIALCWRLNQNYSAFLNSFFYVLTEYFAESLIIMTLIYSFLILLMPVLQDLERHIQI
jgi:hypothetical protein